MRKEAFVNRVRSLSNIDGYLLPELTEQQQRQFLRDPVAYLLKADDAQSDAIMREVESRQGSAHRHVETKTPRGKKTGPANQGQREMLLPIAGKKAEDGEAATQPREANVKRTA